MDNVIIQSLDSIVQWASKLPLIKDLFKWFIATLNLPFGDMAKEFFEAALKLIGLKELFQYIYRKGFRRRSTLERKIDRLNEDKKEQETKNNQLNAELDEANASLEDQKKLSLKYTFLLATREVKEGNEDAANYSLEQWLKENSAYLADAMLMMADYHITRSIPEPSDHLKKARSFLQFGKILRPDDEKLRSLLLEIDRVHHAFQEQAIKGEEDQLIWNDKVKGDALIQLLLALASRLWGHGNWTLAFLFSNRAAQLSRKAQTANFSNWFAAEIEAANYGALAGAPDEAISRLDHALDLAETRKVSSNIRWQARCYRVQSLELVGRYTEALDELERFSKEQRDTLGIHSKDVKSTIFQRAKLEDAVGNHKEALSLVNELADLERSSEGASSLAFMIVSTLQLRILMNSAQYDLVLAKYEEIVSNRPNTIDSRHPVSIDAQNFMAVALLNLGRDREALRIFDEIVDTAIQIYGPVHPQVLGMTLHKLQAMNRHETPIHVLALFKLSNFSSLGLAHPTFLRAQTFQVSLLSETGDFEGATKLYNEIAQTLYRVFGERQLPSLLLRQNHAHTLSLVGDYDNSLQIGRELLTLSVDILGDTHPYYFTAQLGYAVLLNAAGRFSEALIQLDTMEKPLAETFGSDDITSQNLRYQRAVVLSALGRHEEALHKIDDCITQESKILGSKHMHVAISRSLRNGILIAIGQLSEIENEIRETLSLLVVTSGEGSHHALMARYRLARYLHLIEEEISAREEISVVIELLSQKVQSDHLLLKSARHLLSRIDGKQPNRKLLT